MISNASLLVLAKNGALTDIDIRQHLYPSFADEALEEEESVVLGGLQHL